jgi:outer membrane protein assembly factor BamB
MSNNFLMHFMEVFAMNRKMVVLTFCAVLICACCVFAQDWPQWRGATRDAKATLTVPKTWPKELNKKWNIPLGVGTDSTPALVGDKLYVFTRIDANEAIICLDAASNKEIWRDGYAATNVTGAAQGHPGPRSSPTVADGKIFTLGVGGVVTCWDTATHKRLWQKDDFPNAWPQFFTSMSPLVTDGLCIVHVGGQSGGAVIAYNPATGDQKWKWTGPGPSYSSPSVMTVADTKMVVIMTMSNIVGLKITDGTSLWEIPFAPTGMGYNTCTPIIDGATIYYSGDGGRGVTAATIKKEGDKFTKTQLWTDPDNSTQYNTPILKNGFLYGFSITGSYFCIDAKSGKTAWTQPAPAATPAPAGRASIDNSPTGNFAVIPAAMGGGGMGGAGGRGGGMGGGRGGRGGGGMGGAGFGSIVDAGSVLIGLNSSGKLVILEPNEKEYKEITSYQVTSNPVYAYPIVSGNRIYIRDQTSITLYTIE